MSACTFFWHRDCPDSIRSNLRQLLQELISEQNVEMFYLGNQGHFDALVRSVLQELAYEYPHIQYAVVLAYMPGQQAKENSAAETMLPEGIETIHPRYAISWRNDWMLRQSDYVVTYITHTWGGAYQYAAKARKQGKTVISVNSKSQALANSPISAILEPSQKREEPAHEHCKK